MALQELFDNADDTLFEMADRARNDVEQNIFFEAMRDLRLKRKNIERGFLEQFFEAFAGLTQYDSTHNALPRTLIFEETGAPHRRHGARRGGGDHGRPRAQTRWLRPRSVDRAT